MAAQQDVLTEFAAKQPVWRCSVKELSCQLQSGTLSPVELLEAYQERINALNPTLNAITVLNPHALSEAAASARRLSSGQARSELEGIPVLIKDNLHVQGMTTTWGSRLFEHAPREEHDELPVERLRQAGMVILGKTNVPEFTLDGHTSNSVFGTTVNPWHTALTPGGSSGGSVSAVAAGLAPCAIGTDGGGSIRRPASHTGLVGMKPSIGQVPRANGLPRILLDFEVVGPITRTVDDNLLLLRAMAGPDPRDWTSLNHRLSETNAQQDTPPLYRILYVPRFGNHPVDTEVEHSVSLAAKAFQALGHHVEEGELPFDLAFVDNFWPQLGSVGVGTLFRRYPEAEQLASSRFVEMAAQGENISAPEYLDALDRLQQFRQAVAEAFQSIDFILTPSTASLPWPIPQSYPPEIAGYPVGPRGHAIYTGWVNACGHPAVNLPTAPSDSGVPIGFQLVGRFGADSTTLGLAKQYESYMPALFNTLPDTMTG